MPLPVLLTKDHFTAWRAIDPSSRADDLVAVASKCMVLLLNQASLDFYLPTDLLVGLDVGYDVLAADVTVL
jgi:hypothetical protein